MNSEQFIDRWLGWFFSDRFKHRFETFILYAGLLGFAIHLALIFLHDWEVIPLSEATRELFDDPISAIYTPFSFILIYEVYLLVYHLPTSLTSSIGKQYEIISLIIVRRIFKDISQIELEGEWWRDSHDITLAYDMVGFLVLFALILFFYYLAKHRPRFEAPEDIDSFIYLKKGLSLLLLPVLFGLGLYSLVNWGFEIQQFNVGEIEELSDVNKIFYNEFFTILILVDVVILIMSFKYTDEYSQLIRNSGFVISTVLIRLAFSADGLLNILLMVIGVLFGCLILAVSNGIGRLKEETGELEQEPVD